MDEQLTSRLVLPVGEPVADGVHKLLVDQVNEPGLLNEFSRGLRISLCPLRSDWGKTDLSGQFVVLGVVVALGVQVAVEELYRLSSERLATRRLR